MTARVQNPGVTNPGEGLIHPSLLGLAVPIDSLKPDPRNARSHSERNVGAIEESLKAHGQRKPIVVQLPGRVVRAGNGTMTAALRLGWTHLAAVMVEESDADALAFAIRDNRTAELAEWDLEVLAEGMHTLADSGIALESLGFEAYEYETLMSVDSWEAPEKDGTQHGDKRISLFFSAEQWEQLEGLLKCKPTAEEVLERLKG